MSRAGEKRIPKRSIEDTRRLVAHGVEQGMHPDDAAEVFDVGRSTVYNWMKQFRENGPAAFRVKKAAGRPRKLSDKQMAQLRSIIIGREPRQLQVDFALWARDLVREVILRKFGVTYTLPAVGNILHDHRVGKMALRTADEMRDGIKKAVFRLQSKTETVLGFFRDPDLSYITTCVQ